MARRGSLLGDSGSGNHRKYPGWSRHANIQLFCNHLSIAACFDFLVLTVLNNERVKRIALTGAGHSQLPQRNQLLLAKTETGMGGVTSAAVNFHPM